MGYKWDTCAVCLDVGWWVGWVGCVKWLTVEPVSRLGKERGDTLAGDGLRLLAFCRERGIRGPFLGSLGSPVPVCSDDATSGDGKYSLRDLWGTATAATAGAERR